MTALRPYQRAAVAEVEAAFADGARSPLLVMPTGAGKTVVASGLIQQATDAGERALFLAPRRELILQASRSLDRTGVAHGVLLAGADHLRSLYSPVQVASIDTLLARMVRRRRLDLVAPQLVLVDEAHLAITRTRTALLARWPDARIVGLTATPTRRDGRALGMTFDQLIEPITVAELTELGYLVPARYFAPSEPDLERIRTVAGEYNLGDLDRAMNRADLVGDIVQHWLAHAAGRRTVVFCTSIDHSAAMAQAFLRAGIAAEHVDANTPQTLREQTFARFEAGATMVLCNVLLASYGFDLPELSCVVMARPTKSLMLHLQMIGRGLRTADGKRDCLVLDHAGNVHRHGFAADPREWTLQGKRSIVEHEPRSSSRVDREAKHITCHDCSAVFTGTRTCPECGYYLAPRGREVQTLDGRLVEIGAHLAPDLHERAAFYLQLRGYAAERGYRDGWAAHQYRERFGAWPPREWCTMPRALPDAATRGWIKSRLIAWARAREQASA